MKTNKPFYIIIYLFTFNFGFSQSNNIHHQNIIYGLFDIRDMQFRNENKIDYRNSINSEPIFPIGTKWTYDFFPPQINPKELLHSFITYHVTDTIMFNGKFVYKIENNRGFPIEYMLQQEGEEIYLWDSKLDDYQFTYDFDEIHSFKTKWTGQCQNTLVYETIVDVDTIVCNYSVENWGLNCIQFISIPENGSIQDTLKQEVLQHVGCMKLGLKLGLGLGLCDFFEGYIGDIRCFEKGNSDIFINFNKNTQFGFPCDTIWVEILNSSDDIPQTTYQIFPNPASDKMNICFDKPVDGNLSIFDILGNIVINTNLKESIKYECNVEGLMNGLYIVKLIYKGGKTINSGKLIINH